jgi:hypothetical protein
VRVPAAVAANGIRGDKQDDHCAGFDRDYRGGFARKTAPTSIDATQQVHRLEFSTVDTSAVQEVLLSTSKRPLLRDRARQ